MKEKLKLNPGENLVKENHSSKGSWAETDIWTYAIMDTNGNKVGSVIHTDHTAVKGFTRTQSVKQRDSNGKIIVDETW